MKKDQQKIQVKVQIPLLIRLKVRLFGCSHPAGLSIDQNPTTFICLVCGKEVLLRGGD